MREARGIDLKKAQGGETEQKFSGVGKKHRKRFCTLLLLQKARHAARPSYIMGSSTPWNCTTSHVLGMYFHYSDIAMEMFAILSS